ncbi:MAG TPA: hypothetical protein VGO50_02185 [Pyrinomonadaceae bacterium]|jgi:hypothetical protein|nr:hypothetical protein [Pyrinomonadaceae bacterium]
MSSELKLNPYAVLGAEADETGNYCILIAPKINEGLQILGVTESERPDLYRLLAELSGVGLDLLDIENDLDNDARELLTRSGVLVTAENVPEKPLFSCPLDGIEIGAANGINAANAAQVNPTFRFEPFDLSSFRALIADKHFSPYLPTAWIKSAGTRLDLGYWLTTEQASAVSQLRAGGPVPADIDPDLRAKLAAAEIIIEADSYSEKEKNAAGRIEEAKKLFLQDKYATLRNVIPAPHIRSMQAFYRAYTAQGFMPFGDSVVKRRFRQANEPLARFFHRSLTPLMSKLVGAEIKPSYCYAASYREGADLRPHVDREACEYSFSLQVDYEPEPADGISPWPLWLSTRILYENVENGHSLEWSDCPPDDKTERSILLGNGDCLAYRGRALAHYRYELPQGHRSTSLFFHYVPLDFDDVII